MVQREENVFWETEIIFCPKIKIWLLATLSCQE